MIYDFQEPDILSYDVTLYANDNEIIYLKIFGAKCYLIFFLYLCRHIYILMKIEKKYLSAPLSAQLEVTDTCNHRCIHCYNLDSDLRNRPLKNVSDETVITCAQRLIDCGIFAVIVTGGEPLIKKELTKNIIQLFTNNHIRVSLNTNLSLVDDDFISFLVEEKVGILTSCPSAMPISYKKLVGVNNYERFEKNIKKTIDAGVRLTVNMVITKDNLNEIRTTAQKMQQLGVKSFAATPMSLNMEYPRFDLLLSTKEVLQVIDDLLWVEKALGLNVDVLEALPKCIFSDKILSERHSFLNRKCQAGRTVIAVSCNGDVRPCAHNPITYGNILSDEIHLIWERMSAWRSTQYVPRECKNCTWLNRCNGGCRTNAKTLSGNWDAQDAWVGTPIKSNIPQQHREKIVLSNDSAFLVNKDIRYRQEYDDIVVVYNIKDDVFFMINNAYYDFILKIGSFDVIKLIDLQRLCNIKDDNKAFNEQILFLLQKGILKII